ncbi:spermidine synthase [Sphingoaurantiacus capsulatus]|uniref:Spermidine synthase n=1 Tax=Sphingoaurantiacus capsulatus TaxID=1771310 RepID=A0ABV7XDB7_9SPHN
MILSRRALFTLTIFVGSFLLFLVQPLIARLALPRLGGAPAVWNTAMLFYQAVLLLGYLYAHALARAPARTQAMVHLALLAGAALMLPIGLADFAPPATSNPAFWLLGLLAASIGPLFLAVSAQAPLMQAWFAAGDDRDPYFLYAASNAGSLLALLAYPFLVEPLMSLGVQSWLWSGGYALLIALVAACAWRTRGAHIREVPLERIAIPWRKKLYWVMLAFVPSGLLLSTTTHLTTDVMAMPLLWVAPLAIYLITFIIAFSSAGEIFCRQAMKISPILLLVFGSWLFVDWGALALLLAAAGLVLLFYVALALHGELARTRPPAGNLTEFYLWVSVGGMIGGLFCGLLAPLIFDWSYEHPILLILAAALIPAKPLLKRIGRLWQKQPTRWLMRYVLPTLSLVVSLWVPSERLAAAFVIGGMGLAAILSIGHRKAFAVHFLALMLGLGGWATIDVSTIPHARERSFFGTYEIRGSNSRRIRELVHGTTLHGVQSTVPAYMREPMTYYVRDSGVGKAMTLAAPDASIGFVGLGTGTLACYAQPGQSWTAFEIDPAMVRIARDKRLFSYLSRCKPDIKVDVGDARLRLGGYKAAFDLLAVDAFSSDAIPLHLMTAEAFDAYARSLKPGGLLLVHISNRHLDLEPVVAAIAKKQGWTAVLRDYRSPPEQPSGMMYTRSQWIMLGRDKAAVQRVLDAGPQADWRPLRERKDVPAWTDDFASALPLLKY